MVEAHGPESEIDEDPDGEGMAHGEMGAPLPLPKMDETNWEDYYRPPGTTLH
jgi:hypothetical protein